VVAEGDAQALDALEAWLHEGPPLAQVERVERQPYEGDVGAGFATA
jgi:acylphosphatase